MSKNSTTGGQPEQVQPRRYLIGTLEAATTLSGACPYAKALTAFSLEWGETVLCCLPCKRWGCRSCGPRKARKMAYRVEAATPNKFITLTVNPLLLETPRQAYDRTRRDLSELAKKLRKRLGEFEYLRILEVTKKGMPHYHLMARCPYIPQSDLSDAWAGLTNAPIVDIRKIQKCDNVFRYMIKYLCKQTAIPWTDRRASWTRHFFRPEEPFDSINLDLQNPARSKLSPQEICEKFYYGRELLQLTPTAYIIMPKPGEESYKLLKKTGALDSTQDDHDGEDF